MTRLRRRPAIDTPRQRPARPTTNPALADLQGLVGTWDLTISNARFLPNPASTVESRTSIEWGERGDVLVMHQGQPAAGTPHATWVIGRDENEDDYIALYCDDRRVSRVYRMRFDERGWRIWRDSPGFNQRFTATVGPDGDTIRGSWEMSADGRTWLHDFDLIYRRRPIRSPRPSRRRA